MGPLEATFHVLQNYAEFSGRASRAEYWWFVAAWTVACLMLLAVQGKRTKIPELTFYAVTAIPVMSVSFRRLQDAGYSGWWSVAELVAFFAAYFVVLMNLPSEDTKVSDEMPKSSRLLAASAVVLVILTVGIIWHFSLPSQPGPNEFGPNPHEVAS